MRGCAHILSLCIEVVPYVPDLNEFISTEEAAEKFKYHIEHVRRMIREDGIVGLKIGSTWLVERNSLDGFLKRTSKMSKPNPRRNM